MSAKNILSFLGFLVILATVAVLTKVEAISSATIGLEIVLMLFGMMSLGIKNLSSRKDAKFFTL
ncbi:MAG TPA: hypothetical protein VFS31_13560, partial [Chitinophagaceae bacterium]|nr:hypothetical protein [Chitinophagaceae bacterium]